MYVRCPHPSRPVHRTNQIFKHPDDDTQFACDRCRKDDFIPVHATCHSNCVTRCKVVRLLAGDVLVVAYDETMNVNPVHVMFDFPAAHEALRNEIWMHVKDAASLHAGLEVYCSATDNAKIGEICRMYNVDIKPSKAAVNSIAWKLLELTRPIEFDALDVAPHGSIKPHPASYFNLSGSEMTPALLVILSDQRCVRITNTTHPAIAYHLHGVKSYYAVFGPLQTEAGVVTAYNPSADQKVFIMYVFAFVPHDLVRHVQALTPYPPSTPQDPMQYMSIPTSNMHCIQLSQLDDIHASLLFVGRTGDELSVVCISSQDVQLVYYVIISFEKDTYSHMLCSTSTECVVSLHQQTPIGAITDIQIEVHPQNKLCAVWRTRSCHVEQMRCWTPLGYCLMGCDCYVCGRTGLFNRDIMNLN